ncbi:tumor protein D53 isoform X4 [Hippoglossus stenolepis]|uniref:tumor protein D53 isoform X4 n=1 Tax=Hippoglossus stenolepis TaxID=195615 RepID=UPI00159C6AE8|nr:tumor protein D53 isoform X4 [Hippoglossus stenolepis]
METRQQELYSSVLSEGAVVDWGSMGPGEEWVNSATHEGEQGGNEGKLDPSAEESVQWNYGEDSAPGLTNGENPTEWGQTSPPREDRWGPTSVSHSDNWVMSTIWDMQLNGRERGHLAAGFLDSEPLKEDDEDLVSEVNLNSSIMTEEEREEAQQELAKLEEEINTLRQVLSSKEKQHAELKQKLGISPLSELRTNFSRGWQDMQSSTAKTSETLSTAGQKTSAAFSTFGTTITKKLGDMRNSPSFKSFEEKVESTVSTIKTKVGGTGAGGSFEEVLSSAANASSQDTPTNNLTDSSERQC